MKPALFLDRDGVLNADSPNFIKSPEEWLPLPGVGEALAQLSAHYTLFVVSNQSGLAKGLFSPQDLVAIHRTLHRHFAEFGVSFEGIFFCPHDSGDNCHCRKPAPGMLEEILRRYAFHPTDCLFVGDSLRDLQAAAAAGVKPVLVLTGNGREVNRQALPPGSSVVASLDEVLALAS